MRSVSASHLLIDQLVDIVIDRFNVSVAEQKIRVAVMTVLCGSAAIEEAARKAGHVVSIPFAPGRTDATDEMTELSHLPYWNPSWTDSAISTHAKATALRKKEFSSAEETCSR